MTKSEIVHDLSERTGLSLADSQKAVEGIIESMQNAFAVGKSVYFRGFGSFQIVTRKARKARDICKNTEVSIPAHNTVKFIPSNSLIIKQ